MRGSSRGSSRPKGSRFPGRGPAPPPARRPCTWWRCRRAMPTARSKAARLIQSWWWNHSRASANSPLPDRHEGAAGAGAARGSRRWALAIAASLRTWRARRRRGRASRRGGGGAATAPYARRPRGPAGGPRRRPLAGWNNGGRQVEAWMAGPDRPDSTGGHPAPRPPANRPRPHALRLFALRPRRFLLSQPLPTSRALAGAFTWRRANRLPAALPDPLWLHFSAAGRTCWTGS